MLKLYQPLPTLERDREREKLDSKLLSLYLPIQLRFTSLGNQESPTVTKQSPRRNGYQYNFANVAQERQWIKVKEIGTFGLVEEMADLGVEFVLCVFGLCTFTSIWQTCF